MRGLSFSAVRRTLLSAAFACLCLPVAASAADASNGKRLYLSNCAGCQGSNGQSIMPDAPNFARGERLQQADFTLVNFIKTGSQTHPPFLGIIVEKEMYDVVAYLRIIR